MKNQKQPKDAAFSIGANNRTLDEPSELAPAGPPAEIPDEFDPAVVLDITDILDLHPFQPREVADVVHTYLQEARKKGFPAVRIIHGKGTGTQREIVHSILKKSNFVASYQDAPAEAGGWGATIAWLSS